MNLSDWLLISTNEPNSACVQVNERFLQQKGSLVNWQVLLKENKNKLASACVLPIERAIFVWRISQVQWNVFEGIYLIFDSDTKSNTNKTTDSCAYWTVRCGETQERELQWPEVTALKWNRNPRQKTPVKAAIIGSWTSAKERERVKHAEPK